VHCNWTTRICSIMSSRRSKGGLLARVNFPLYTVQMITNRHILVGGGGGSSKTGVANGFVSLTDCFSKLHLIIKMID